MIFRDFAALDAGLLHVDVPRLASVDWPALALSLVAAVLLFRLHLGVIRTLAVCVVLGLGLYAFGLV